MSERLYWRVDGAVSEADDSAGMWRTSIGNSLRPNEVIAYLVGMRPWNYTEYRQ